MIFSQIQKPIGMGKTRVGKRIYVQGVPINTSWFCPYCCATVDTAFVLPPTQRVLKAYVAQMERVKARVGGREDMREEGGEHRRHEVQREVRAALPTWTTAGPWS